MVVDPKGVAAPDDLQSRLGLAAGTAGLVDLEMFASIYTPGKLVLLASWRDAAAAQSWEPAGSTLRHRQIRIIRDYGMFERREAPQYYPTRAPAPRLAALADPPLWEGPLTPAPATARWWT
jgi:hypothetical protein